MLNCNLFNYDVSFDGWKWKDFICFFIQKHFDTFHFQLLPLLYIPISKITGKPQRPGAGDM